jgi:AcrR family transcriptional regulator
MTRVVKAPDVRRLELLETAYERFAAQGYEETSVQEIVDRVGVAKGTFYHYFGSKEDLLEQVAEWQAEGLGLALRAGPRAQGGSRGIVTRLREVLRSITGWDPSDPSEVSRTRLRILYLPGNLALRARLAEATVAHVHPELEDILRQGVETGVMELSDPDATADVIAAVWRGNVDHIAGLILASESRPEQVPEVVAHLRAIEHAVERILGMDDGTLRLYEPRKVRRALREALDSAPGRTAATAEARPRAGRDRTEGGSR